MSPSVTLPLLPPPIPVIDFRRQRSTLQWNAVTATWTAYDIPPALVHGVALIRAAPPNICLYARDCRLYLQIGGDRYTLSDNSPRIRWRRALFTLNLRRHFTLESNVGDILFTQAYWNGRGLDFFLWLAARAADPQWRAINAQRWSEGMQPAELRSS